MSLGSIGKYVVNRDQSQPHGQQETLVFEVGFNDTTQSLTGKADGPLGAFCQAMSTFLGCSIEIKQYSQSALAGNQDAKAISCVQLQIDGQRYTNIAIGKDTLGASLQALLNGMNRHRKQTENAA